MKIFLSVFAIAILTNMGYAQSVGIGNPSPNSKSILDISSTDKGLLIPRMLSSDRSNISTPIPAGLMVYQTNDIEGFYYYDGFNWAMIGKGGNFWTKDANGIYTMGNNVGIGTTMPNAPLSIETGTEATLSDGSGYVLIGNKDGQNIVIDNNEIQTRNDGVESNLLINPQSGNVGIGTSSANVKLKVDGGTDASLTDGGFLQIGPTTNKNILFDDNEIMARNNGDADQLILQNHGGNTQMGGKVGLGTIPDVKLHISNGGDAGVLTTTTGFLQMGATNSTNIIMDNNEIMARNNGVVSDLILQNDGGRTLLGGDLEVDGVIKGAVKFDEYTVSVPDVQNYTLTVGNRTFIKMLNPFNNTVDITLTDGESPGQILVIVGTSSGNSSFGPFLAFRDNASYNTELVSDMWLHSGATFSLIWSGTDWYELSRSNN